MIKIIETYKYFFIAVTFCLFGACKTTLKNQQGSTSTNAPNKQSKLEQTTNTYPVEPGTCKIMASVFNILNFESDTKKSPCHAYHCQAYIIIMKSYSCGYNIPKTLLEGDTLLVHFTRTLVSSNEYKSPDPNDIFLPGLKNDQLFDAQIKINEDEQGHIFYEIKNYELIH